MMPLMEMPPPPMLLPVSEPARRRALRRWQRAAGPFAPLVAMTPFLADAALLDASPLPDAPPWAYALVGALHDEAAFGRPLAIVDGPAAETLAAAPLLARRGIAVVPVMRRWPVPNAILPPGPLLAALLTVAPHLRQVARWRAAALLVESERLTTLPPAPDIGLPLEPLRTALDNRYALDSLDLPAAAWLQSVGVERVLAVVLGAASEGGADQPPPGPAPDVADWLAQLARAGFPVGLLPV